MESALIKTNKLIPQLAPTIAEYTDNTVKGYLACNDWASIENFHNQSEKDKKEYRYKHPEFFDQLEINSKILLGVVCSTSPDYKTQWTISSEFYLPAGIEFPCDFPLNLLRNKKEGDKCHFRLGGVPFVLICNQKTLNPKKPQLFENAIAEAWHGN